MPKKPRPPIGDLLAGDVSISLDPVSGSPVATLAHPDGGSCQVSVRGANVVSWRPAQHGGAERILRAGPAGSAGDVGAAIADAVGATSQAMPGGLSLCNFSVIPAEAWTVEILQGRLDSESPLTLSLFADVLAVGAEPKPVSAAEAMLGQVEGGVPGIAPAPVASRIRFQLYPNRLEIDLEVANAFDEDEAGAANLELGRCGFEGVCCGVGEAAAGADVEMAPGRGTAGQPIGGTGVRLSVEGFEGVSLAGDPASSVMGFKCLATEDITLEPGQALSGQVALEVL